jgi:hypothetical protein
MSAHQQQAAKSKPSGFQNERLEAAVLDVG